MSVPETFNPPNLQIWNNAAFDVLSDAQDSSFAVGASLSNIPPDFSDCSFGSHGSKENHMPSLLSSSSVSAASIGKSKTPKAKHDRNIDAEIKEIEEELRRSSARLETLRLEKAELTARRTALRGRIVPARFLEQKQSSKNLDAVAKVEHLSFLSAKSTINRRGVSLGPADIFSASKSKQPGRPEMITLLQATQNRRRSCLWKLPDIYKDRVTKARGRMSLSLSPKSRRAASRIEAQKQAATTVGSRRAVKKDEGLLSTIQPKRLFKDGAKKPLKSGRIVASRYSQINDNRCSEKDGRKRSLPENCKAENSRCEKRRNSDENGKDACRSQKSEVRGKKRWEIPEEVVVYRSDASDESPISVSKMGKELPKIRTFRCTVKSPRDSGAAKRVAELEGRKGYFS